jgi:uncharacterized membrane protein
MKILLGYLATLISLGILDVVWLGVISRGFYKEYVGSLMRADFIWPAIILFYVLYAAAVMYFAVVPASGAWKSALVAGVALGFTAYMTYDLVNYGTLKDWSLAVVIADIAWGCVTTGAAAVIATVVVRL